MDFITSPDYDKLPDFSSDEYNEPIYDPNFPETNLFNYKKWRALWASKIFLDAADDKLDLHVLNLPYHSFFPEEFIREICGHGKRKASMPLHAVESFLESLFGTKIQQPDCDYLRDILKDKQLNIKSNQNAKRALRWVAAKQRKLPKWPPFKEDINRTDTIVDISENYNKEDHRHADIGNILRQKSESLFLINESNDSNNIYNIIENSNILDITHELVNPKHNFDKDDLKTTEDGLFLKPNFHWKEIDELANKVGIISNGKFHLGSRKKSAITGFLDALKEYQIIAKMTQKKLHIIFGDRYDVVVNTDKSGKAVRPDFRKDTARILEISGFEKPTYID